MVRKVFRTGNSLAVPLPDEVIELLGLGEGSEIDVEIDIDGRRILLTQANAAAPDIDSTFARQLDEFIEQYRSALVALAR